ncbi:MAG TPA: polyprenyl synthetase family protein [Actinomycetota bacterium]|nr:polyprenyl synthetase family protein [Actinomycetota bacterium]
MRAARSPSANDALANPVATPSSLVRLKPLISAGLRDAVDHLSPRLRRIVSYHLGWQDEVGGDTDAEGGKALRPTIALVAAEAVGSSPEAALPGAIAVELVHNFSLLHDDVMDGDRERRHRPTVWARFGLGEAIIAGDALLALAQRVVLEDSRPEARRAAEELNRATAEMIEGQSEDLSFESRLDVSIEECLSMSAHKTAALLSAAAALGAILGGADEQRGETLRRFGRHLGLAFQAVDDVLGIWGDPMVTGKPSASDLRQRKKTIPVAHGLSSERGGELKSVLSSRELSEDALRRAVRILEEAGSRELTLRFAWRTLVSSMAALEGAALAPRAADELRELAGFVVQRDF